jgi:hypothetical protein
MKTINLNVNITFSGDITSDNDIQEIVNKVKDALVLQVDHGNGITPDESDFYTESIEIREEFSGAVSTQKFYTWL